MEITERRSGDVAILEFSGRLAFGVGDSQARERIAALLAAGERKVLIGLAGVTGLDSSGVSELVAAQIAATDASAELGLAQLSPQVAQVFKITHVTGVFEIFDSLEEGLLSLS